jgi:biotin carboxylase
VKETPMAKREGEGTSAEGGGPAETDCVILVICPTHRDHRELPRLSPQGVKYLFHDYASISLEDLICNVAKDANFAAGPLEEMDAILAKIAGVRLAAVVSTDDYPGSALAAAMAKELGLPGPDPAVTLICQHKYLARCAQEKLVPDAVPPFTLIDVAETAPLPEGLSFPLFVKPVKSFFSIGAERVDEPEALAALFPRWAAQDQFFAPLEEMLRRYAGATIGTKRLIAEGVLRGEQVTVEGFVHGGKATVIGIVDSVMFPGTLVFARFDYPSALPGDVQQRMSDVAATLMPGLGFDHGMFNIEMMYDPSSGAISIIEINPRMASQFADLYEKVDGTNSYAVLLDIAQGRAPRVTRRQDATPSPPASCFAVSRTMSSPLCRARPISNASSAPTPTSGSRFSRESGARFRRKCRTERVIATASSVSAARTATTCWRNSLPAATVSESCSSRSGRRDRRRSWWRSKASKSAHNRPRRLKPLRRDARAYISRPWKRGPLRPAFFNFRHP